jgi:hypothetical protein
MRFSTFAFAAVLLPITALGQGLGILAPDNALERSITLARGEIGTDIITAVGAINQTVQLASNEPVLQSVLDLANAVNTELVTPEGIRILADINAGRKPRLEEYVDTSDRTAA